MKVQAIPGTPVDPADRPSKTIPGYVDDRGVMGSEATGVDSVSEMASGMIIEQQEENILGDFYNY
jgi:hypothetical protein